MGPATSSTEQQCSNWTSGFKGACYVCTWERGQCCVLFPTISHIVLKNACTTLSNPPPLFSLPLSLSVSSPSTSLSPTYSSSFSWLTVSFSQWAAMPSVWNHFLPASLSYWSFLFNVTVDVLLHHLSLFSLTNQHLWSVLCKNLNTGVNLQLFK